MADIQEVSLYDRDFCEWAQDQARAMRGLRDAMVGQGNLPAALAALDWDNLFEELDDLAGKERRELRSRIATIVEHLAKLALSPSQEPRAGWRETVRRSRIEIELLFVHSPSLHREVPDMLRIPAVARAAKAAVENLADLGEIPGLTPAPAFNASNVLEDWWPDQKGTVE